MAWFQVGWYPVLDVSSQLACVNCLYPTLVFLTIISGYVIQLSTCFARFATSDRWVNKLFSVPCHRVLVTAGQRKNVTAVTFFRRPTLIMGRSGGVRLGTGSKLKCSEIWWDFVCHHVITENKFKVIKMLVSAAMPSLNYLYISKRG